MTNTWCIQKVNFATTSEKKLFCENERLEPTWKSGSWAIHKISFPRIVFATKISRFCLLKQGPLKIWRVHSRQFTFVYLNYMVLTSPYFLQAHCKYQSGPSLTLLWKSVLRTPHHVISNPECSVHISRNPWKTFLQFFLEMHRGVTTENFKWGRANGWA